MWENRCSTRFIVKSRWGVHGCSKHSSYNSLCVWKLNTETKSIDTGGPISRALTVAQARNGQFSLGLNNGENLNQEVTSPARDKWVELN